MRIDRTNIDGRNEIELRPQGEDNPTFVSKQVSRVFGVSCDAKAEGGEHTLRFVARNVHTGKWEDNKTERIPDGKTWLTLKVYLTVPPTSDVLLRIDDEAASKAPSSLFIRNLVITEEQ